MECPVCMEIYETPLLLPGCGHTLCRSCAEMLITEGNFLRCPECRLVYQLRQGIKSLPKNVALERTIEEHAPIGGNRIHQMCEDHPEDAVSLYCKTCEKSICLKCYFTSNTLRKGQSPHSGHQVDTSEDAFTKEKRMLEERRREYGEKRIKEREYVYKMEKAEEKLKTVLEEKMAEIEKNKNDIITKVKQTTGKLKFTLKGSMVRDGEFLSMALTAARERLAQLDRLVEEADLTILQASQDLLEVNVIKEMRKKFEALGEPNEMDRPTPESFLKIDNFDTDVNECLHDPKKALSYQTESPRTPEVVADDCVISTTKAFLSIKYNETVRVKAITVHYKEAMYKGMSEKKFNMAEITNFGRGSGQITLKDLQPGNLYRLYVVASNDFGESPQSTDFWFRTLDGEVEMRNT